MIKTANQKREFHNFYLNRARERGLDMSLFSKVAASAYASKNSMGSFLNWNDKGGITPRNPDDEQTASQAGLKTLPAEAEGANCATCRYFKVLDDKAGSGFCVNPELKQEVTARMLCDFWENPGTEMAVEEPEPSMMDEEMAAQEQQGGQSVQELAANGEQPPMDQAGNPAEAGAEQQPGAGAEQPGAEQPGAGGNPQEGSTMQGEMQKQEAPKKEEPKEKKPSKGPQVNIKVDSGEKQASIQEKQASFQDFVMESW